MSKAINFTLEGRIPSKKNSRTNTGKGYTVPSQSYGQWAHYCGYIAKIAWKGEPTKKPVSLAVKTSCINDIDNLIQSIMDALKGVVYEDDKQVVYVVGEKIPKDGKYRTEVILVEYGAPLLEED